MAKAIPKDVREKLLRDPFMQSCCVCGHSHRQWHHNLIFGGKAINEHWCILPLCVEHHEEARNKKFKDILDWIMFNRATDEELAKYSKVMDYIHKRYYLNGKFGKDISPRKIELLYEVHCT